MCILFEITVMTAKLFKADAIEGGGSIENCKE